MKNMVADEVCHMPIATISAIVLSTNKTILFRHLFNEDGEGPWSFSKVENYIKHC
jgi:hypothetical protein